MTVNWFENRLCFVRTYIKKYLLERELYTYTKSLPGERVSNWPELIENMDQILVGGNDLFSEKRLNMKEKIYSYDDGDSCSRLYSFMQRVQYS